ncbi:MAG: hypothetical protein K2Y23_04220 [Cyanobacteria bacterium]|nr:hypothetical protein [Cyanobacteriota bacterium]
MCNTSSNLFLVTVCLAMLTGTASAQSPPAAPDERFISATREYALMHRRIE